MKKTVLTLFLLFGMLVSAFAKKVEIIKIHTDFGDILVWLYDETPKHKANFMKLTKSGFYNGTTFHRIIPGFVVQGGDPNSKDADPKNDGEGGPKFTGEPGTYKSPEGDSYTIDAEILPDVKHKYGSIAAARTGDNINPEKRSSGSQFYIAINKNGIPHLDAKYTVYGEVIQGMEVAEKIAAQPKGQGDRPNSDIKMTVEIMKISAKKLKKLYNFQVPVVKK